MPLGKTSGVPWFSSMITRILLTPVAAAVGVAGDDAAGAAETGAELGAGGPAAPAPQPAARQPISPPPIRRASGRMAVRLAGIGSGGPDGGDGLVEVRRPVAGPWPR